jgi:hypothetical protein
MKKALYILAAILLLLIMAGAGIYLVRYHDGYFDEQKIVSTDEIKTIVKVNEKILRLYNHVGGYAINYPCGYQADLTLASLKSELADDQHNIEVYSDNFTGKINDARSYIGYSNGFLTNDKDIQVEMNKYTVINGRLAHLSKWQRASLPGLITIETTIAAPCWWKIPIRSIPS